MSLSAFAEFAGALAARPGDLGVALAAFFGAPLALKILPAMLAEMIAR